MQEIPESLRDLALIILWSRALHGRFYHFTMRIILLLRKVHLVKTMFFPVVMYGCELDHKEGWVLKNWCFWTVVLEKTLESPLDCKEMEPVNPKGNQLWIFIGRTNAEVEAPKLWPPDAKNSLRKDPDAGKDWRQEKRTRGWDGWMASPTYRTWVWASSGRWWRTGKPDVLQSMGSQRIQHNWAAEPPPPPPANEHGIMSLYFMKLLESSKF